VNFPLNPCPRGKLVSSLETCTDILAILDATYPIRWAVIEYSRIRKRLGRWPLATLHAIADADLSKQCTGGFCELLAENSQRLRALTFHLLCDRVLRGRDRD
jgi:hypothetical protein